MVSLTLIAVVTAVFAIYYFFSRRKERYPPGPTGIPLFGNMLSLDRRAHLTLDAWGKKYGSIYSIDFGSNPAVVITDVKLMREAMNEAVFSGRSDNKVFNLMSGGKFGVLSTDGDTWLEQRRFTLRNLRDFGFGKNSMETIVMEEVQEVLNWMKKEEGHSVRLDNKFRLAVLNALWSIMAGERYEQDDPHVQELMETGSKTFNEAFETGIAIFFPQLAEYFPNVTGWKKMVDMIDGFRDMFVKAVRQHEDDPAADEQPRDFIDVYLNEIKKTTDSKSSFYKEAGRKHLTAVVGDLHGAGSETTSQTLIWAILYLIRHPEVQKKLQKEIDDVVGHNRMPCLADKPNMRYMEAFLMEVLRLSTLVPLGLFHNTMAAVEFHGYKIPKDTWIVFNHYSAHYSKEAWGDPENFRPERFLSPDGKTVLKNEALISFGAGKRACLGESLARDELFLFITSIFQKFEMKADPASPVPTMEPTIGFLQAAEPFNVIMKDRLS